MAALARPGAAGGATALATEASLAEAFSSPLELHLPPLPVGLVQAAAAALPIAALVAIRREPALPLQLALAAQPTTLAAWTLLPRRTPLRCRASCR
ncbi:MAG: hypothetical protein GY772_23255 [bacterium]|nr:hypothetical protein [bacterium]